MGKRFSDLRHDFNTEFEKLLNDHKHGELHSVCDYSVIRPAYAYTSICPDERWREGITPGKYVAKVRKENG